MLDFYSENIPLITDIIDIDESDEEVNVVKFRFYSERKLGRCFKNEIYTVVAYPKKEGKYPGLLILHGGTQNANMLINRVISSAKCGYIALAPELPVLAEPTKESKGEWVFRGYMNGVFENSDNPFDSSLYETICCAVDSFNTLCYGYDSFIDESVKIDIKNIGITGFSWGGYMTLMLCGILKDKVKVGFSNYGCGFYDYTQYWNKHFSKMSNENKDIWLANFDAGRRANEITAPFFIASPTNDTFFYPTSVMATLKKLQNSDKGVVFSPNSHHCIKVPGGTSDDPEAPYGCAMEYKYFDYYLKGIGSPFPKLLLLQKTTDNNDAIIKFDLHIPKECPVKKAELYFSDNKKSYPERKWEKEESADIKIKDNEIEVTLRNFKNKNYDYFLLLTDEREISVSSEIFIID